MCWSNLKGDTAAAGAILDRFLHHAEIIKLEGRSYRMHDRKESWKGMELTNLTEETK
jgi:DNA replication protein DnaC